MRGLRRIENPVRLAVHRRKTSTPASDKKPWRLSSSVIALAPSHMVPKCSDDIRQAIPSGAEAAKVLGKPCDYRICFVKRTARSTFMPNVMVFPGGAVDASDKHFADAIGFTNYQQPHFDNQYSQEVPGNVERVTRVAAVREAFEEAGIPIFTEPAGNKKIRNLHEWRHKVHEDARHLELMCQEFGVQPALNDLAYWCSFITPDMEHKRLKKGGFDTHFYLWCAPDDVGSTWSRFLLGMSADDVETVALEWMTPHEALAAVSKGVIAMAPPQWYIVHELAEKCPTLKEARTYARGPSRTLRREYPIKPYLIHLSPAERAQLLEKKQAQRTRGQQGAADGAVHGTTVSTSAYEGTMQGSQQGSMGDTGVVIAMAYPGDEMHPVYPGPVGARHRMTMTGEVGKGLANFDLDLTADTIAAVLPLQEAEAGWYQISKL
eukprot:m.311578 g.311578  ORF g.311578 m.311578 type:complete len:434 (+) comp20227_c0_seq4:255-1556(+)